MQQDREWHLDKKVPLALILTLALQSGAFIWWAAKADNRLDNLERDRPVSTSQVERIVRLEAKMDSVVDTVNEVKLILRSRPPSPPQ
jgi:hypothetical protein